MFVWHRERRGAIANMTQGACLDTSLALGHTNSLDVD